MLQAQNGRQLNLAAKVVRTFLEKKNVKLQHADALQMVSHLIGYPNYEAAKSSLEGDAKGLATGATTWRELAHAIGTLDEAQLDLDVQVTQGCDSDGISTFSRGGRILLANEDCIAAGQPMFPSNQPVLLVEEFDPTLDSEDADRIRSQFEVASGESGGMADHEIKRHGLQGAVETLNADYAVHISLGKYVAYSDAEQGFWNIDFGFVHDKASATGFDSQDDFPTLVATPDLEMVSYAEAVDVDPDADDQFSSQVRGKHVSRYQWPMRFDSVWSEVSVRVHELLKATKTLVEAKGFGSRIAERDHAKGTGRQLVLELYSGEQVFGGRLVFALADGQRSGFVVAAALGVFLEIPERESIAYSLNIERSGEFPYATEAYYFLEELLEQTPKKLAEALMLHANFQQGSSNN